MFSAKDAVRQLILYKLIEIYLTKYIFLVSLN